MTNCVDVFHKAAHLNSSSSDLNFLNLGPSNEDPSPLKPDTGPPKTDPTQSDPDHSNLDIGPSKSNESPSHSDQGPLTPDQGHEDALEATIRPPDTLSEDTTNNPEDALPGTPSGYDVKEPVS